MTVNDYIAAIFGDVHDRARYEARRQYDRAVERHFVAAHKAVVEGKPTLAELYAEGAAALRTCAHQELKA